MVAVGEREYTCIVNEYGSAAFLSRDHRLPQYRRIFLCEYQGQEPPTRPDHIDPSVEIREMEITVVAHGNHVPMSVIEEVMRGCT